ncbi:MAG: ATP-binding domain-containing protein [Telluria sp.]
MAIIIPSGWREVGATGAAQREIDTLALLETGLPGRYTVYHGVHWTRVQQGVSAYGEIDFIVLAPDGKLLLIEQKSGFLSETEEGLVRQYRGKPRRVASAIARTVQTLSARFARGGHELALEYLLYCPDYHVRQPLTAGIDPARIVDAGRRGQLVEAVRAVLPPGDPEAGREQRARVERFLNNELDLAPDPSALVGVASSMVTRLSGGLAAWARQLEFEPFRLRVQGTAGSGKTQLALAEYRAAIDCGQRPLYVCYNRPLADHVFQLVPEGGRVANFHQLCDAFLREHGQVPDYADGAVWERLDRTLLDAELPPHWQFDVLIVDEGQDFSPAWRDAVLRLLRPGGRALWLEDPLQNLYGREPVALPGWVTLHADTNYRSPRQVVDMLVGLAGAQGAGAVHAASPFLGADVDYFVYPDGDTAALHDQCKHAVSACLAAGFTRSDIALLSFHGRERSQLLQLDRLGPHTLRSFTGDYDAFGSPLMRHGDLLAESVYRFKGQAAPAVILAEVDFVQFDERTWRKLFVGMTRAKLKLALVMSASAAEVLLEHL